VDSGDKVINFNSATTAAAACPTGKVAVGGGFYTFAPSYQYIASSVPSSGGTGWSVTANTDLFHTGDVGAWAICVSD
jgi:hypothetical protein